MKITTIYGCFYKSLLYQEGVFDFCTGTFYLASGSSDYSIRIWDIDKRECIRTLNNWLEIHILLELADGRIASGSSIGTEFCEITLWNIETGLRVKVWCSSSEYRAQGSLHQLSNHLLVVSEFDSIYIWDIKKPQDRKVVQRYLKPDCTKRYLTRLLDDRLASCSSDGCIVLWKEE